MKIYFIVFCLLGLFSSFVQAQECQEALNENISDLMKVSHVNNEHNGRPLQLNIEFSKNDLRKESFRPSFDYNVKDLALDAGVFGTIMASKSHLPDDKFKHVVAGALITYGATEVAKIYFRNSDHAKLKAILTGVGVTALVGILKEVRDKQGYGTPEAKDAYYTSLGGALVSIRYSVKF